MLELKVKKMSTTAILPTKAHPTDACFDLYADLEGINTIRIPPHTTIRIHTGIATEIPHGYWAPIYARSGLATKNSLRPANCVGVIDESYRGEWIVPLHNDSDYMQYVSHGDRIAQFTLASYYDTEIIEVDELNDTDRGTGGFGSSGA